MAEIAQSVVSRLGTCAVMAATALIVLIVAAAIPPLVLTLWLLEWLLEDFTKPWR